MKSSNLMKAIVASAFVLGASAFVLGASTAAMAQANTLEVAAGGGFAHYYGSGNSLNKGKFDASVSYNVLSSLAVGFEYGFSPLQSESETINGYTANQTEHLNSYGIVVRFGLTSDPRMQPYIVFSGGGAKDTISATASAGGEQDSASDSQSGGYYGFGGGLNAMVGHHFGVRPEFRFQRITISDSSVNDFDVRGSIFYRFGGR